MSVLKTKRNIANTAYCFEARKFYLNFKSRKPSILRAYPDCEREFNKLLDFANDIFTYTVETLELNWHYKTDIAIEIKLLINANLSLSALSGNFSCFIDKRNFKESFLIEVSDFLKKERDLLNRQLKKARAQAKIIYKS